MEVLGEVGSQNQEEARVRRESSGFQLQLIPRAEGWSGTQDLGSKPQGRAPLDQPGPLPILEGRNGNRVRGCGPLTDRSS